MSTQVAPKPDVYSKFHQCHPSYQDAALAVASPASGHVGTLPPWRSREFFFAKLYVETIVWFGLVLCQTLSSALFVQPYSLWNDTITEYNGACAKVNVVFTARRYALARSLLSASVCRFVCPSRSCIVSRWLKISSNFFFGQEATSF